MSLRVLPGGRPTERDMWRKKLIKAMPRSILENMIDNQKRPWNWDRPTVESHVLTHLTDNDIDEMLNVWKRKVL